MFFFILGFIVTIILIYKNEWDNKVSFKQNIKFMDWGYVFLVGILTTIAIPTFIVALSLPFLFCGDFQMDLKLESQKRLQPLECYEETIYLEKTYYFDDETEYVQYQYSTEFYNLGNRIEFINLPKECDEIQVFIKFDEFNREPPMLYIYKATPKDKAISFFFIPIVKTYYSFVIPVGTALEVN